MTPRWERSRAGRNDGRKPGSAEAAALKYWPSSPKRRASTSSGQWRLVEKRNPRVLPRMPDRRAKRVPAAGFSAGA